MHFTTTDSELWRGKTVWSWFSNSSERELDQRAVLRSRQGKLCLVYKWGQSRQCPVRVRPRLLIGRTVRSQCHISSQARRPFLSTDLLPCREESVYTSLTSAFLGIFFSIISEPNRIMDFSDHQIVIHNIDCGCGWQGGDTVGRSKNLALIKHVSLSRF